MGLLITGVLLWSVVHCFPAALPTARSRLALRLGPNAYRGLFSVAIVLSIVLIVIGWRRAGPEPLYVPALYASPVVPVLVFVSFYLFAASHAPGNAKRWLRHPMLTGTLLWAGAHLLANGEVRSVVLFGGLGLWAIVSILLINHRDGPWIRPPATPLRKDLMTLAGTAVVFAVVALLHDRLFGVPPFPAL